MEQYTKTISNLIEDKVREENIKWLTTGSGVLGIVGSVAEYYFGFKILNCSPTLLYVSLMGVASTMVLALARRSMRKELVSLRSIVDMYGEELSTNQETNSQLFFTEKWHENVIIDRRGDTEIQRDLAIRAGVEPIRDIWHAVFRNSGEHLEIAMKKSSISVHYLNDDGSLGARLITTHRWSPADKRLKIFIHFTEPLSPESLTNIRLTVKWPRYSQDLLDGSTETNYWIFRRETSEFSSTYLIKSSFTKKAIGITPLLGTPAPIQTEEGGLRKIHLVIDQVKPNHKYGYMMSLNNPPLA